jgi:hypothetical protein
MREALEVDPRAAVGERRLFDAESEDAGDGLGSAAPVRLIELRTHGLHRKWTSTAKPRTTGLENGSLRGAVGRGLLCFETGRRRSDLPADRMTGSGRQEPPTGPRRATADIREAVIGIEVPVCNVQQPVGRRPRIPAPDPKEPAAVFWAERPVHLGT